MPGPDRLSELLAEVAEGRRVPYLGAGVAALAGGQMPASPPELCAAIEAKVRAPKRARGNMWSVAQFVESRRFRKTLEAIVQEAFADQPAPGPLHRWLARVRPPLLVDAWYDSSIIEALQTENRPGWGLVQGVSRNGESHEIWTRAYDAALTLIGEQPDPDWEMLVYKPHGVIRPGHSFLMSDSDYVEVLTEIDIQSPIPDEVQNRRSGRPFLFLGCRFDDQMLRLFARQIAKRSAPGHAAVIAGDLTRMEARFMDELGIERLDLPLDAVVEALSTPV
ncbi:SIR2 family NAD-dependent protein deacylase [Rhodovulum adriaticum]|uniref:SIR2-like protein n=1 Tax=Rhodovulum adriaticum TaxID=35804 RepID=A0A4R2NMN1_RHOAD|nr:SIR2 family protein [Rhodovulum adriaticum]MBK1636342.1 SIR2 family protein [Rhodovulum adriaticum]TCP22831.1 SIR2-like protein [Rhodovulum adriaticum]